MSAVPQRGIRPSGISTCVYAISDDIDCGQRATWHIWWVHDEVTSSACEEHYRKAIAMDWEILDAHPFGGVCLMPATRWQFSAQGELGFCFMPIGEVDEMAAEQVAVRISTIGASS